LNVTWFAQLYPAHRTALSKPRPSLFLSKPFYLCLSTQFQQDNVWPLTSIVLLASLRMWRWGAFDMKMAEIGWEDFPEWASRTNPNMVHQFSRLAYSSVDWNQKFSFEDAGKEMMVYTLHTGWITWSLNLFKRKAWISASCVVLYGWSSHLSRTNADPGVTDSNGGTHGSPRPPFCQ
jgi:hypothetical protein